MIIAWWKCIRTGLTLLAIKATQFISCSSVLLKYNMGIFMSLYIIPL